MPADVFLSYARAASAAPVRALADSLRAAGVSVFLDEREIAYGDAIPSSVIDGLLGARVVVVFAEPVYFTRWYCQLEYAAAVAGFRRLVEQGAPEVERVGALAHVIVALPPGGVTDAELDALPGPVRRTSWTPAADVTAVTAFVRQRLADVAAPLRDRLATVLDTRELSALFAREAPLPQPLRLAALPGAPPLPVWTPLGVRGTLRDRFVGRADDLWRLHDALAPAGTTAGRAAITSAVRGVGGVGKTQLVAEYLYRYGPRHYAGGLFWIDATRAVGDQHHAILRKLDPTVPDLPALNQQFGQAAADEWLRERLADAFHAVPAERPVLLVVDDVPEPEPGAAPVPLETWCPAPDAVACIVTSRAVVGFGGGGALTQLSAGVLAPDDAIAVLTGAGVERTALSGAEWREIAAWVGHLPLALVLLHSAMRVDVGALTPSEALAAAVRKHNVTRELDGVMEALRPSVPAGALRGVSEAFLLSYRRLSTEARAAARLLGWLAAGAVPTALVESLGGAFASPTTRTEIRTRGFVMPAQATDGLETVPLFGEVHAVVADFLRTQAEVEGAAMSDRNAVGEALLAVMAPERSQPRAAWPLVRACARHADQLVRTGTPSTPDERALQVRLMQAIGRAAAFQGDSWPAAGHAGLAVVMALAWFGAEHELTLEVKWDWAGALDAVGKLAEARDAKADVVATYARLLGPEHPTTLRSSAGLASTLLEMGEFIQAREMAERVLPLQTRQFGDADPDTLVTMFVLGRVLRALGQNAEAQPLVEHVRVECTRLFGADDPSTLASASELAGIYRERGDAGQARKFQEMLVDSAVRILGPEHPDTLRKKGNLALTLDALEDYDAARTLQEEVYKVSARLLGPEDPDTLTSANNLAHTLLAQGDLAGARALALLRQNFAAVQLARPSLAS